jgi:GalNAc-alpha-(1->4)-GalNAc-alpha-(1->3)-diNAcBac-PP-undecaprenol alpha-1,4-N-acetyl-D-galactosaminyltransferase
MLIPSLGTGGAERMLVNLASKFSNEANIELVCFKRQTIYDIDNRVKIIELGYSRFLSPSFYLFYYLLKDICNGDATIFSFTTKMNVVGSMVSKIRGLHCIVSERNNLEKIFEFHLSFVWKILVWYTYRFAGHVVVQTEGNRRLFESMFRLGNVKVIPNFIKLVRLEGIKQRTGSVSYNLTFLCVARFVKQKNQFFLIKAFERLLSRNSNLNLKLVLVGDGPLLNSCKNYVEKKRLGQRVIFPGVQKEVGKYYLQSDVFVLPSLYEGFPNVLLEAMMYHLPIISSDCDFGPSELLSQGEFGLLYNGSINDLVEKMEYLFPVEKRIYFSNQSRIRIADYSDEQIVLKWLKLL